MDLEKKAVVHKRESKFTNDLLMNNHTHLIKLHSLCTWDFTVSESAQNDMPFGLIIILASVKNFCLFLPLISS